MTDDIIRWKPGPGRARMRAIDTRVDHVDEETGETFYRVWPAGYPEPKGNPAKWAESTLRELYEMVGGDGDRG